MLRAGDDGPPGIPDFASGGTLRILLVDDNPADLRLLLETIRDIERPRLRITRATTLEQALRALEQSPIDLCITDFDLRTANALDLYKAARNRNLLLPFIAVTGAVDEERLATMLLSSGFDDVLLKNVLAKANLYRVIRNAWLRNRNTQTLIETATVDELTGLLNRRGLMSRLDLELTRMRRVRLPLAVLFMDLDGFKAINDTLGHTAGDQALIHFARMLRKITRSGEHVGRLGGDEFAIVMPGTTMAMGVSAELRLGQVLRTEPMAFGDETRYLESSIGIIVQEPGHPEVSAASLLDAADRRMYEVKAVRRSRR